MLFKTSLPRPGQPHMHEMVGSTTIGDGEIRKISKSLYTIDALPKRR
jgi:hypothetical protein